MKRTTRGLAPAVIATVVIVGWRLLAGGAPAPDVVLSSAVFGGGGVSQSADFRAGTLLGQPASQPLTGGGFTLRPGVLAELIPPTMTGRAYGAAGTVAAPLQTVTLAPTPDTGPVSTTSGVTTSTPCTLTLTGVVTAHSLCAKVTITVSPAKSTASASLVDVSIKTGIPGVPIIAATGVKSTSQSTCAASSGTTSLGTLTIGGIAQATTSIGPNSMISISGPPGTKLILNEQSPVPGGLTVNAMHLIVPGAGGVSADIVIASATSDIHNCS